MTKAHGAEQRRLEEATSRASDWKGWGPYLSERAWGTVREDYSPDGSAWTFFPHDHARSRVYRWNEDGLGGICNRDQIVCFALGLWNEKDPIIKERLYGLAGPEGNHGEDVKEYYFYSDSTPTHSYMKMVYKYPQRAFPYQQLLDANNGRSREIPEYELMDTGVFEGNRYFDVDIEYAKADPEDICIKITAHNRGPEAAPLHLLPTLWYRNTWSWGYEGQNKPSMKKLSDGAVAVEHPAQKYWFYAEGAQDLLFCDNETNIARLFGAQNKTRYVKDGINDAVVHGNLGAVNTSEGTKVSPHYIALIPAGKSHTIRLRISPRQLPKAFEKFDEVFKTRLAEADEFYGSVQAKDLSADEKHVQRQAFAGLLWTKQWFHYDVASWLNGDPAGPKPPEARKSGRNAEWGHMHCADVISMPDKWEYPWFAAWDLAFHCVPLAMIDSALAKRQLILMLREWYMHPNGQIPAYEWIFGDVNPPVHAWAAWRVYKIEKKATGKGDTVFLERIFHKLLINFTWWVNRKDASGNNVFQGGFLGMDNIGVFDRSRPLPTGGHLEQSDGTSWMGMYCLNLMVIALELARTNRAYEDVATKFFEHFMYIAQAMNNVGGLELWSEKDEFFYDVLAMPDSHPFKLRIKSMVGLIPLFAVETIDPEVLDDVPGFRRRMEWFLENKPEMSKLVSRWDVGGKGKRVLIALLRGHRMKRVLKHMLNEDEFLSPGGIRGLSREHADNPYVLNVGGEEFRVDYEPGDSRTGLFGGNSNWRGPVWMPVNYLILESLQKFYHYYSDDFLVECPTGSGHKLNLWAISMELARRIAGVFLKDGDGRRPVYGDDEVFQSDPHWKDHVLFYEYFHGDSSRGLGASHQTGWTALVAKLIQQLGDYRSARGSHKDEMVLQPQKAARA